MKKGNKYGTHRVIEPIGVLPQPANKIPAVESHARHPEAPAAFEVQDVAGRVGDHGEVAEVEVAAVEGVDIAGEDGAARGIGALKDDGVLRGAVAPLPVVRQLCPRVGPGDQPQPVARREGRVGGDPLPGLADRL